MCSDLPARFDRRLRCCGVSGLGSELALQRHRAGLGLRTSRVLAGWVDRSRLVAGMQTLPANEYYRPDAADHERRFFPVESTT